MRKIGKIKGSVLAASIAIGFTLPSAASANWTWTPEGQNLNEVNQYLHDMHPDSSLYQIEVKKKDGYGWVQEYVPHTLTLYKETSYYNSPHSSQVTGALSPQTVMVVDHEGNRFKVETVYGDKWVNVPYRKDINLIANTGLYASPEAIRPGWTIPAGTKVLAVGESEGFYQIVAEDGSLKWIKKPVIKKFIQLEKTTNYYDYKKGYYVTGTLSPQKIGVVNVDNGWYQIDTDFGFKWMKIPYIEHDFVLYETMTKYYLDKGKTFIGDLAPQTIRVLNEEDGWYQIQTDMGERWIKKPYRAVVELIANSDIYYYEDQYSVRATATIPARKYVAINKAPGWYQIHIPGVGNRWIKESSVFKLHYPVKWTKDLDEKVWTRVETGY